MQSDLSARFKPLLRPDETLLWVGKPQGGWKNYFSRWRTGKLVYAITNLRVLVDGDICSREIKEYSLNDTWVLYLKERKNGEGDILFGNGSLYQKFLWKMGFGSWMSWELCLERISGAKEVYEIIQKAQATIFDSHIPVDFSGGDGQKDRLS